MSKRKRAIIFPLYNKAFKLLADSNIPLFCLAAAAAAAAARGVGEERVIDGATDALFKEKTRAEKSCCLGRNC